MFSLILYGPVGFGTGILRLDLTARFNLMLISIGELLRQEVDRQTALGTEIKPFLDKGELLPKGVIMKIVESALIGNRSVSGFLFDGFPRNIEYAKLLDILLEENIAPVKLAFSVKVSDDEIIRRILYKYREDDQFTRETVTEKVIQLRSRIEALDSYYTAQGKLKEINGEWPPSKVFASIYNEIEAVI
jgi:adenylate kinase